MKKASGSNLPNALKHASLPIMYSAAHLNPEGRYTREKPFCPQISQMIADF